ncbi:sigma-70 family RNA polymerase sigma factor [Planctomycetales bacterium ZRK34]|nr:sigma-70 family RNA polymerase sigma factor [Planctomycetales bacterium ZRK34]
MSIDSNTVVRVMFSDRTTLLAFIWTLVRDVHVAEDIFQDIVMEAMAKAADIEDTDHLRAWIRQAARFRSIDHMRRQTPVARQLDDDVIDLLDEQFVELEQADSSDLLEALSHCLGHLTPRGRQLIEMRYGQSMTGKQVADQMGQTAHSVYVAMNRIYRRLAECIHRRLGSDSIGRANHP